MNGYVIETRGLTKTFGDKQALADLSLRVEKGGVHALIGSNGAGKSTLFRVLLGFLTPSAGESFLLGEDSTGLKPRTRGCVGYVNEEHTLPGWLKVQNLERMQRSFYADWNEDVYRKVIANFDVDPRQRVSSLSKGERAGLNLAMALAQSPELLILDEPTLGLDVVARQEFLDAILFSTETETTVIYCSHQMEEVERLAERLIILERGRLRIDCSPEDFSDRVQLWVVNVDEAEIVAGAVPGILSSRVIEDELHVYVLDPPDDLSNRLTGLGVADAVRMPIGLDAAVRAYLALNHTGTQQ